MLFWPRTTMQVPLAYHTPFNIQHASSEGPLGIQIWPSKAIMTCGEGKPNRSYTKWLLEPAAFFEITVGYDCSVVFMYGTYEDR